MPPPTRVRDRRSGQLFEERVFGGDALHRLYGTRIGRLLTDHALTGSTAHRLYGWLQRRPQSRAKIPEFVRSLAIDTSEAERPLSSYGSLDEFFTRRLKGGARSFDPSPRHLCAPAEGRVLLRRLDGKSLEVKRARVTLDELLGDPALAARYRGGHALVVRLAPADYHRFHFPDWGDATPARAIPGRLHSVHPIALAAGAPSFRNRRMITELHSDSFGRLQLVEIGALCVGTIVQTYRPGRVERGMEKGLFHMGGSTVVLLTEPDRVRFDDDLVSADAQELETLVRLGERVGSATS